jgi:hypothetical protein
MILDSSDCPMKKPVKRIKATFIDKILVRCCLLDVPQEALPDDSYEFLKLVIIFLRGKGHTSSSAKMRSADAELSTYLDMF